MIESSAFTRNGKFIGGRFGSVYLSQILPSEAESVGHVYSKMCYKKLPYMTVRSG